MNTPQMPSIEVLQASPPIEPTRTVRWPRWKVFLSVLLLATALGLAIVYGRSPVYRAVTVLTVAPKAVDMQSSAADVENVAIQGRLLLSEDLLGRVIKRLSEVGEQGISEIDQLRRMLEVVLIPETNLLELRADGNDPEQLHRLVNLWTESYENFRLEEIEAATQRTTAELEDQQSELARKIETIRNELLAFRQAHDIVSLERDENRSLSALRGLNDSLNKAKEILIEARARKIAIDEAIAKGKTVVPREGKTEITRMQLEVERIRAQISDLQEKFTQRYIDRDPDLAKLPETLVEMERDLALAIELGRTMMKDEAAQAIDAAQVSVTTLEEQLVQHQNNVQNFTQRFKEFKAFEEGLTRLEILYADNAQRIAQIEVRNREKFPPLQVVEWAHVPTQPIYPNYDRDLLIALGAALTLALFVTWLFEYLAGRPTPGATAPHFGVRIYPGGQGQILGAPEHNNRLPHDVGVPTHLIQSSTDSTATAADLPVLPRELAAAEVKALLAIADQLTAGYCALLLSGVSPYELSLLNKECFETAARRLNVPGVNPRSFEITPGVWDQLHDVFEDIDHSETIVPITEIEFRLVNAARKANLSDPPSVNGLALWHSYVVYLVRQGIDDSELISRVGAIPPDVHQALKQFSPQDGNRELSSIDLVYPALVA